MLAAAPPREPWPAQWVAEAGPPAATAPARGQQRRSGGRGACRARDLTTQRPTSCLLQGLAWSRQMTSEMPQESPRLDMSPQGSRMGG